METGLWKDLSLRLWLKGPSRKVNIAIVTALKLNPRQLAAYRKNGGYDPHQQVGPNPSTAGGKFPDTNKGPRDRHDRQCCYR